MATVCAVCNTPCRGRCAKCGARLCAQHKPASARAKCAICKRLGTSLAQAVQAIPPYAVASHQSAQVISQSQTTPLATLTMTDQLAWIGERRSRLRQKQARERAYLNRRAARRTHTPTDDAYEADQILENELFEALDLLVSMLQGSSLAQGFQNATQTGVLFIPLDPHGKLQP
ncbi:MAG TPA: hypothetical protein VFN35_36855 [Ktedonobacteraceae bacterium]|nr:hypothetical protein [Ktedonobacteraceae bacterium]